MNIVQQILDQLSGAGLGKLSTLLGIGEAKTEAAVGAAVPAMLGGMSSLASTSDGAQKLASAFGKFDPAALGSMLSGQAGAAADQGGSMLNSLFGGSILSGITGALSKFTGLGDGLVKTIMGYLTPVIMGVVGKQLAGKGLNAQSVMSLFSEQKNNIANAMPSGLSLGNIPGLASVGSAARAVGNTASAGYGAAQEAGSSILKWMLPLAAVAAIALLAYAFWPKSTPTVPDVTAVTKDLTGNFTALNDTLSGIRDVASAEAALPRLMDLNGKLDGMKATIDKLPDAGKTTVTDLIKSHMGRLSDQFNSALMIPGVSDKIRPALETLAGKAASLAGLPAGQFALPSLEVTRLGSEFTGSLGSLTETLTGIKDAASADAAMPKLKDIGTRLGAAKGTLDSMPAAAKSTIGSALRAPLAALKGIVDKVLAMPVIGDKLKPVVEPIMNQLTGLGV